jgi:hypothetical protein
LRQRIHVVGFVEKLPEVHGCGFGGAAHNG